MIGTCVVAKRSDVAALERYSQSAHLLAMIKVHFFSYDSDKDQTLGGGQDNKKFGTLLLVITNGRWRENLGRRVRRALRKYES